MMILNIVQNILIRNSKTNMFLVAGKLWPMLKILNTKEGLNQNDVLQSDVGNFTNFLLLFHGKTSDDGTFLKTI